MASKVEEETGVDKLQKARDCGDAFDESNNNEKKFEQYARYESKHSKKIRKIIAEMVTSDGLLDEKVARQILIEKHILDLGSDDHDRSFKAAKELKDIFGFKGGIEESAISFKDFWEDVTDDTEGTKDA